MAANTLGRNIEFPILNADGTPFHDLVMRKATYDSVVMSLGDKITGDVFYKDNTLAVTMQEYIVFDGVRFGLVDPPTIVREGMVADNGQLNGMTKYSFVFYHPMYHLSNFSFSDVAVSSDQEKYLSQNKTFSWIGTGIDFIAKLNKNLESTEWIVVASTNVESLAKLQEMSEVLQFDKNSIADAFKKAYETWEVPFVISQIKDGEQYYAQGKRFLVTFGLPANEIYTVDGQGQPTTTPFIFQFGKGVGLKNNSRTPKNNKIITRIAGLGSERNVPYGYPQIIWTGNQDWNYTINNSASAPNSYPIYDGIVAGQRVRLIKHPFTRTNLMPSIYAETVNKKVNPYATGYDPTTEIKDYYDADNNYPNPMVAGSPSFEVHEFEDIYPRLTNKALVEVKPYDGDFELLSLSQYNARIQQFKSRSANYNEKNALQNVYDNLDFADSISSIGGSYTFEYKRLRVEDYAYGTWYHVKYTSGNINFEYYVYDGTQSPVIEITWDDSMNDDGEYNQSFFKLKLPVLNFDLYACAAVTQEMSINMRSGACIGCTFPIMVDWEDYKANFYDKNGNFDPVIGTGHPRNGDKYPNSSQGQITVVVQKDNETFGTLMPNIYQQPQIGDEFVILGISLPTSYITDAEEELDDAMKEYMLENNVYYYEYPLKFDEHFLATHTAILAQMRNNSIVRFQYAQESTMALYIKQMTIKYGEKALPQYDITITDDVEIVLNKIGEVTDDVSKMRVQVSELQKYYAQNLIDAINSKLSRIEDDVCQGRITFQQGLDAIGSVIFHDEIRSPQFETGLYTGRGWRIDQLGNAEFESARIRSYLEVVELLVNRLQAQEGDTVFSDNDQIDRVDRIVDETDQSVSYILSLKEKYQGYITGQMYGNVIKGIINTLAAKQAGVSDYQGQTVEVDGSNTYYTSWMRVIATHNTDNTLSPNQIRVVLYGDNEVPVQKNFEPCELMTMTRWGCINYSAADASKYAAEGLDTQDAIIASIKRRQQVFYISTSEGRIVKLTGVDSPILRNGNFGTTLGILPEFVQNYPVVHDRMIAGRDYLYAQGVVVGDFIKIDVEGNPVPTVVDCGEWIDGSRTEPLTIKVWDAQQQRYIDHVLTFPIPSSEYNNTSSLYIGHGIYFYNKFNALTQQYETHKVRHNGGTWQCLQSQPVMSGGVATYYEPKWNSPYWMLVDGNDNLTIEFVSSKGHSFRRGAVNTDITPHLFYGNVDITDEIAAEYFTWTRYEQRNEDLPNPYTQADEAWNSAHEQQKTLHLTNNDMPNTWSTQNKIIFTCTVVINDGKTTRIVDNQIVS